MADSWQQLVIFTAVGVAAVYLLMRLIGWRRRRRACTDCRLMEALRIGEKSASREHTTN
jgi:hypothetical protein